MADSPSARADRRASGTWSPGFMPANDFCEAAFQSCNVERPIAMHGEGLVVERRAEDELRMQPDLLLRKCKRNYGVRGAAANRRRVDRFLSTLLQILLQQFALSLQDFVSFNHD